jgi:hypothetical protein
MIRPSSFTRENTVIEHSQARIERKYIRESPMLEGTRQKSLGNAFRGWNTDWFGGDEGQKRELAGARACLIVKNRTLGSWTLMMMARKMSVSVSCGGQTPPAPKPRGVSKFYLSATKTRTE